jgi:serine/threonine protein kinase
VANIFLHNGKAKIADFGFAKFTKYTPYNLEISSKILILDLQYICRQKDSFKIFMDLKQIYGLLEL